MAAHELLNVVDENDIVVGGPFDKADIHECELLHRDVHVFITDGVKLLQQRRAETKTLMPGQWDVLGEHVEPDEAYLAAAQRGTQEEYGLTYAPERFIAIGKLALEVPMTTGKRHRTIGENFVVVDPGLQLSDIRPQKEELSDVRWYDLKQMAADLRDPQTAKRHAPQPLKLWHLGLDGIAQVLAGRNQG